MSEPLSESESEPQAPRGGRRRRPPRPAALVCGALALVVALLAVFLLPALLRDDPPATVPDRTMEKALELYAAARLLDGNVLSSSSATRALETWCADHELANPPTVRAVRDPLVDQPATPEVRTALQVGSDDPVVYREVELRCGQRLLSTAGNWYVPGRLTEDMNRTLRESDTPFGTVVAPLGISRRTVDVEQLWPLLPLRWETADEAVVRAWTREHVDDARFREERAMFRHEALVTGTQAPAGGLPIALVHETYRQGALKFMDR
ncbi:hypothetical protein [Saccharothrix sp. HUAS TT1]|uniref:hypothetical protein n=1 Tax=unclassified Saccharothrix TaxID=2593673 RepID=UPI00345B75AF